MKYSFIGLGNMASAIIAGMAASGKFKNDNIYGYNRSEGKTNTLRDRHGLIPCQSALEAVEKAEVVVLCVKPPTAGSSVTPWPRVFISASASSSAFSRCSI